MVKLSKPVVEMPDALQRYWTMWNEPDLGLLRSHLDGAVTDDIIWADPMHFHIGKDALEQNARDLKTAKPEYYFVIASELDVVHNRYRYRWHMRRKQRVLMRGLDIATINDNGLIERVDGFFGPVAEINEQGSGIPQALRGA